LVNDSSIEDRNSLIPSVESTTNAHINQRIDSRIISITDTNVHSNHIWQIIFLLGFIAQIFFNI
jgi:hypothetical protein